MPLATAGHPAGDGAPTCATWQAGRFALPLQRTLLMGIVNLTPDSFSDGGRLPSPTAALEHCRRLLDEGADILDLGAESTRPGAQAVDDATEWQRLQPVLRELVGWKVPVSIDTYHPPTMLAALDLGADIINDIHALRQPGALQALAGSDSAGVCLMHMQGEPASMQDQPHYDDVVVQVRDFLLQRVEAARALGVGAQRICIDPGFGFGKTRVHNLELARNLRAFADLGPVLLAGVSRKSMLAEFAAVAPQQRVHASIGAALACVAAGARVLRVHDVAATRDAVRAFEALRG